MMQMIVKFKSGVIEDALLLSVGSDRIRVVVAGRGTTEEWLMLDGHLFDEDPEVRCRRPRIHLRDEQYTHVDYCRNSSNGGGKPQNPR